MRHGMLGNNDLRLGGGPPGHRLVAQGAKLDGVIRGRQRAGGGMLAGRAVTGFAFDAAMPARRPLRVSLGVTRLAVCRSPELRVTGCQLDYGIAAVIAELVIGWVEDVVSCRDRQYHECGEQ
jgi:hypothetical protein